MTSTSTIPPSSDMNNSLGIVTMDQKNEPEKLGVSSDNPTEPFLLRISCRSSFLFKLAKGFSMLNVGSACLCLGSQILLTVLTNLSCITGSTAGLLIICMPSLLDVGKLFFTNIIYPFLSTVFERIMINYAENVIYDRFKKLILEERKNCDLSTVKNLDELKVPYKNQAEFTQLLRYLRNVWGGQVSMSRIFDRLILDFQWAGDIYVDKKKTKIHDQRKEALRFYWNLCRADYKISYDPESFFPEGSISSVIAPNFGFCFTFLMCIEKDDKDFNRSPQESMKTWLKQEK